MVGTQGPFSIQQARALVKGLGIPADVAPAAIHSDDPEGFKRRLRAGRAQIVLHKSSPSYGHYFALVPRKGGKQVELFDSETKGAGNINEYLHRGGNYNGPVGWMGRALDELRRESKVKLTYNEMRTQPPNTETCLLWTLARTLAKDIPPAEFARRAYGYFSKLG